MNQLTIAVLLSCAVLISGCRSYQEPRPAPRAEQAALISHMVFIELHDPNDYRKILADADQMLNTIPSVYRFAAGNHLDTGRPSVSSDYDLAIYLGFQSEEDLATYVDHDQHIRFVERWMPKIKSLRVYDMLDAPMISEIGFRCRVKRNGLFGFSY